MSQPKAEACEIVVKDSNNTELRFKIRKNTQFSKVYNAYASQKQIDQASIVFLFDGSTVGREATPESLGIEDGDVLDAQMHQTGGYRP